MTDFNTILYNKPHKFSESEAHADLSHVGSR